MIQINTYILAAFVLILISLTYLTLKSKAKRFKKLTRRYNNLWQEHNIQRKKLEFLEIDIQNRYEKLFNAWKISEEKVIRKDAIDRSRSIMRGQATEHLAPYMQEELNPKDYRFLGNPIDYIVFSGASDVTDKKADTVDKIIFIDIKTGKSRLNKVQRRIKKCIEEGRVEFIEYNPDKIKKTKEA
jgi:predicted Holliday junction resolvase-like endonuclease